MPRTPGTRAKSQHGSAGNGWGGREKGAGNHSAGPGRPRRDVAALLRAEKAERIAALQEHVMDLAFHAEREETQLSAANSLLDRELGKATQRTEIDANVRATVSADPLTEEEWLEQHGAPSMVAAVGTAEGSD